MNNEMNNIAIAEVVNDIPIVDGIILITEEQILDNNYDNDDEAEFYRDFIDTINYFESFLDTRIEEFMSPDENGELPYIKFIEELHQLQQSKFAKRTWARMRRITSNIVNTEKLTQLQKSEHPDYKDWSCPKCLNYYKGTKELKKHMEREVCKSNHKRLFVKATKEQIPSATFLHTVSAMEDLYARAIEYRKNIEPELEEEEFEEPTMFQVRTYWLDDDDKSSYSEIYESNGKYEWENLEDAKEIFNYAWSYWSGDAGENLIGIALTMTIGDNDYEVIEELSVDNNYLKNEEEEYEE